MWMRLKAHRQAVKRLSAFSELIPSLRTYVPSLPPRLHLIGKCDIVGPYVKLPLPESQHATVYPAAVDAHPHVHVHAGHLPHQPAKTNILLNRLFFPLFFAPCGTNQVQDSFQ